MLGQGAPLRVRAHPARRPARDSVTLVAHRAGGTRCSHSSSFAASPRLAIFVWAVVVLDLLSSQASTGSGKSTSTSTSTTRSTGYRPSSWCSAERCSRSCCTRCLRARPSPARRRSASVPQLAQLLVRLLVEPHPEERELGAGDQEQRHEHDRRRRDLVVEEDPRAGDDEAEQRGRATVISVPST